MKKSVLIPFLIIFSAAATGSDKMSEKNKKWLLSQPGVTEIGCNSYEDSTYSLAKREEFYIRDSSFNKKRLFVDSKLVCDLWSDSNNNGQPYLNVIENAKINGIPVSVFHGGGSGTVGKNYSDKSSWHTGCKTDAMTDEFHCYVYQKNLYITKDKSGYHIFVGSEHFPNTKSFIRIDNETPLQSEEAGVFSDANSNKIVSSVSSRSKVVTRFTKWPYERFIDENIDMKYFDVAKETLDILFENHK